MPPALCVVGEGIQTRQKPYAYIRDLLEAANHPPTAVIYENLLPLLTDLCPECKLENDMQHIERVAREDERREEEERRVKSQFHRKNELYEGNQFLEGEEMQEKENEGAREISGRRPTFDFGRLRPRVNGRCIKV